MNFKTDIKSDISGRNVSSCVLMFSGGRDSSLAALKLGREFSRLILVTVTSPHLTGLNLVRERLREFRGKLPPHTDWLLIHDMDEIQGGWRFGTPCDACNCAAFVAGMMVASRENANKLAFGYTSYQSAWPEQTPYAISRLKHLMSGYGITLTLPVYSLATKKHAVNSLSSCKLSTQALEQKTRKSSKSPRYEGESLKKIVAEWEEGIRSEMCDLSGNRSLLIERFRVGDFW